jgi:hypothetical protein
VTKDTKNRGGYVQQVRENTRQYIDSLLGEIEQLQDRTATVERERDFLQEKLDQASNEIVQKKTERDELSVELEKERERNAEHHAMIEEQNNNLANLYVASYGLHGTLATNDILCAIKEIVTNLVGSEELAIFELCEQDNELKLIDSIGVDTDALRTLSLDKGLIGHAMQTGKPCVSNQEPDIEALPHEEKLTACIPLMVSDVARGAIAIFGLLQQKTELADLDFELFDLLGSQAANALYTAQLHEQFGAR